VNYNIWIEKPHILALEKIGWKTNDQEFNPGRWRGFHRSWNTFAVYKQYLVLRDIHNPKEK
jgi:hypothetical protein